MATTCRQRFNSFWCVLILIVYSVGSTRAQEQADCYGPGSIATSVVLTFVLTLLLIGLGLYLWKKYRSRKEHLILETDPEKGKGEFAFDNPGFKDTSLPISKSLETSKLEQSKSKWNQWSPLTALTSKSEKRKTLDDTALEANEVKVVALRSHDFTGLGFNICGNMKEGIFIKDILHRGPAFESRKLNPGDRINSVTISFEHMVYEDALTILSYASPYEVMIEAKGGKFMHHSTPGQGGRPSHPVYRSSSLADLYHAEKSSKKRLFADDYPGSNYSSLQKSRSNMTTLERKDSNSPKPAQPKKPKHLTPDQLKTQLEQRILSDHQNNLRPPSREPKQQKTEAETQRTENKHQKFGVRVLPMDEQQRSPKILEQNENNVNIEINDKKVGVDEVDATGKAPPVKKREKKPIEPESPVEPEEFERTGSGIRRDPNGIPEEIPSHMLNAALAARRNRKSSDEPGDEDDSKPAKRKGKAPSPPPTDSKPIENRSSFEEVQLEPSKTEGEEYNSDSDIETDNRSSANTIELNPNDITIHQTEEQEVLNRKTASTGDLTKIQRTNRKTGSGTLERAQSLDITEAAIPGLAKKRKEDMRSEEDLFVEVVMSKEPRLSLILDGLTTFQRNRLKKSTEWGDLEDAILKLNQDEDDASFEDGAASDRSFRYNFGDKSPEFEAFVNKIHEIKRESFGEDAPTRNAPEVKIKNQIWPSFDDEPSASDNDRKPQGKHPKTIPLQEEHWKTYEKRQQTPKTVQLQEEHPKTHENRQQTPKTASSQEEHWKTYENRQQAPKTISPQEQHLKSYESRQQTPKTSSPQQEHQKTYENREQIPQTAPPQEERPTTYENHLQTAEVPPPQDGRSFRSDTFAVPFPEARQWKTTGSFEDVSTPEFKEEAEISFTNVGVGPGRVNVRQSGPDAVPVVVPMAALSVGEVAASKGDWSVVVADGLSGTSPPLSLGVEVGGDLEVSEHQQVTVAKPTLHNSSTHLNRSEEVLSKIPLLNSLVNNQKDDTSKQTPVLTANSTDETKTVVTYNTGHNRPRMLDLTRNFLHAERKNDGNEHEYASFSHSKSYDTNASDDIKVSRHAQGAADAPKSDDAKSLRHVSNVNVNDDAELRSLELSVNETALETIDGGSLVISTPDLIKNVTTSEPVTGLRGEVTLRNSPTSLTIVSQKNLVEITENNFSTVTDLPTKPDDENETVNPKTLTYITEIQVTPTSGVSEVEINTEDRNLDTKFENYVKNFESKLDRFENNVETFTKVEPKSLELTDVKELHKIEEIAEEQLKKLPEMRFTTSSYSSEGARGAEKRHSQIEILRSNFERPPKPAKPEKSRIPIATATKTPPMSPERRDSRNLELEHDRALLELMSSTPVAGAKAKSKNVTVTSIRNNSKIPSGLGRPPVAPRRVEPSEGSAVVQVSSNGNVESSFKQWVFNPGNVTNVTVTESKVDK